MAGYFTLKLYFHSPLARENKVSLLVKSFAITHYDSCNKYIYIYAGIKSKQVKNVMLSISVKRSVLISYE